MISTGEEPEITTNITTTSSASLSTDVGNINSFLSIMSKNTQIVETRSSNQMANSL